MVKKKGSLGRQKIKIEKIIKKSHRQVTFSKRRTGLFKKASELCTLCGVEIAIIVFSPADKAFSFGNPSVESVIERFCTQSPSPSSGAHHQLIEAHRNASVRELNLQLAQILSQLEAQKKHGEALNHTKKASQNQCWWEAPIDQLCLLELQELRDALEELKKKIARQASEVLLESANSLPFWATNDIPFPHVGNFEIKPEIKKVAASSVISHVSNFGYGHHDIF